jgi:hypothetical protein
MSSSSIIYAFSLIFWSASRSTLPWCHSRNRASLNWGFERSKAPRLTRSINVAGSTNVLTPLRLVEQMRRRSPPSARTIAPKPPSSPTLFEGIAAAVCGLGFVAYRMRKSAFAKLRRERADFRSSIRKRRSEPVRGYRPSPAHALQQHEHRHIGQWSAGLLTEKTNSEIRALASSLTMARAPLGKLHAMLAPRLHARRRDGPVPRIEIEFPPFGI